MDNLQLEGRRAVLEALEGKLPVHKILFKKGEHSGSLQKIIALAKESAIPLQAVEKKRLDELSQSQGHQGVMAFCSPIPYAEVSEILQRAQDEDPFVVILDGITDPYNLGAIIRTAEACGVHGIIIPKRRACPLTGAAAKASAGAYIHVPVARVPNLATCIQSLKQKGIWVACAHTEGKNILETDFGLAASGPLALVIGSEGEGVSRLLLQKADFGVKIPMLGKIGSLNASVAAGIFMFEVVRRRQLSPLQSYNLDKTRL